jgi:hypothetical protein
MPRTDENVGYSEVGIGTASGIYEKQAAAITQVYVASII